MRSFTWIGLRHDYDHINNIDDRNSLKYDGIHSL